MFLAHDWSFEFLRFLSPRIHAEHPTTTYRIMGLEEQKQKTKERSSYHHFLLHNTGFVWKKKDNASPHPTGFLGKVVLLPIRLDRGNLSMNYPSHVALWDSQEAVGLRSLLPRQSTCNKAGKGGTKTFVLPFVLVF